jgi:pimeloyl-ACP methyl ester carboxylesterase
VSFIDVAGGRFSFALEGSGPPIVLLHGFSFDSGLWDPQADTLRRSHRVLRYDLRGFGSSTAPTEPYRHIDDLHAILGALQIERPMLVGLSLGSNIALAYALEHPDNVAALVLASPGLPGHPWTVQRPPEAAAAYAAEHGVDAGKQFWLAHPIFASLKSRPDVAAVVADMVRHYSGWHWAQADMQLPGPDVRANLEAVKPPTLVLSGEHDVEGYREIAAVIASRVPRGRLVQIAGAGHVVNLEQPAQFSRQVLEFAGQTAF